MSESFKKILTVDPATFPRDDFGPPRGAMPMNDYEKWCAELLAPHREELLRNTPPPPDGEPFVWKSKHSVEESGKNTG